MTDQVLHPKSIEKTNVKLADAAFHESTINALEYYSIRGYNHFKDTAKFLRVIRDWFNTVNVKGTNYGQKTRDKRRNAISRRTMTEDLSFILSSLVTGCKNGKIVVAKGCRNQHSSAQSDPAKLFFN